MATALKARRSLSSGSLEHKVLSWAIAMDGRGVDAVVLNTISHQLSYWPGSRTMRENVERAIVKTSNAKVVQTAFKNVSPESAAASLALALANKAAGKNKAARRAIAPLWRQSKLSAAQEKSILKQFGSILTRSDHRARRAGGIPAFKGQRFSGAQRIACVMPVLHELSMQELQLNANNGPAKSRLAKVPASQKSDPGYLFSKARWLRHQNQTSAAAKVLLSVSAKKIHENAADSIWIEQRILASDLLEANSPRTAYRLAARNVAKSTTRRMDSEFFAGWIALRKLNDPRTAARHFKRILKLASTPLSKSRGLYWRGRALEKSGKLKESKQYYTAAAKFDTTFYGQLSAEKLGRSSLRIAKSRPTRRDRSRFPRYELVQAISKLESAGFGNRARIFYRHLARNLKHPGELALLAARAERRRDYQLSLQIGKQAFSRGFSVDTLAWPLGAIPQNTKTSGAGLPLAYAVARQESTFQIDARSSANALGLLQLLPKTAKQTARSIGIKYSKNKLVTDASYNARLGTAFLKQQMDRFGGSFILTFVAYNAGPSRADQWVKRYGDPRGRSVEFAVDWVEQIPFSETRNYVQRVMENYQVYKNRIKGSHLSIGKDLRAGRRT